MAVLRDDGTPRQAIAFDVDGKVLAAGGQDGTVRMWDVDTRQALPSYQGHAGPVDVVHRVHQSLQRGHQVDQHQGVAGEHRRADPGDQRQPEEQQADHHEEQELAPGHREGEDARAAEVLGPYPLDRVLEIVTQEGLPPQPVQAELLAALGQRAEMPEERVVELAGVLHQSERPQDRKLIAEDPQGQQHDQDQERLP